MSVRPIHSHSSTHWTPAIPHLGLEPNRSPVQPLRQLDFGDEVEEQEQAAQASPLPMLDSELEAAIEHRAAARRAVHSPFEIGHVRV